MTSLPRIWAAIALAVMAALMAGFVYVTYLNRVERTVPNPVVRDVPAPIWTPEAG